jgi:predicted nuclease of restriction endonuclease-like RecB superfamily
MGFPIRLLKYKLKKINNKRYLQPFFLSSQDEEIVAKIEQTIKYFENFVTKGLKREYLDRNEIIEIFEDYKIGSCILQVLRRYYEFQTPTFDTFKSASNFSREGITSPSELRVFLFNQINEDETGFLSGENKQSYLERIATFFAVSMKELEELLWIDDEDNQILVRVETQPPTKDEIIRSYNWNVLDTLTKNSLSIKFQVKDASGTFAKKLHWLCKRYGIFYDMSYDEERILNVKLYGVYDYPDE